MTLHALATLVRLSLSRDRKGAASSVFGVSVGVFALVFFVSLGLGVGALVRERIFPVDANLVEVVPPQLSLGPLGAGKLDDAMVLRLSAIPGVAHAFRKMSVRVPAVSIYDGDFFGRRLRMGVEVLAVGVEKELVEQDVQMGDFSDPGPGKPVPAVLSTRLLDVYNTSFARARGLPQLSPSMLVGFSFPVEFNRSFVAATPPGPVSAEKAQVVGVSSRGLLAGLTVPLETARRLNQACGADAQTYSAVALLAKDPSRVPELVSAVRLMGLRVDDAERSLAENIGAAVAMTTSAFALLSVLICVVSAFNIFHALSASVRARERDLGVMRAVGASRRNIFSLVFAEAALLGLLGGALGTLLARLAAFAVDRAVIAALPDFPFLPESFFRAPWWLALLGLAVGLAASLAGAWLPARRASGVDPARALAGQGG